MARLTVVLTPRGGRDAIIGLEAPAEGAPGTLVVRARVAAPPIDGRANGALERLLAAALDVPPSRVRVVSGHTSRRKQVEVVGVTVEVALSRLIGGT